MNKDLRDRLNAKARSEKESTAKGIEEMAKRNEAIGRELPKLISALYAKVRAAIEGVETVILKEEGENYVGGSIEMQTSKLTVSYRGRTRIVFRPDVFGGVYIEVPGTVHIPFSNLRLMEDESKQDHWFLAAKTTSSEYAELTGDMIESLLECALDLAA